MANRQLIWRLERAQVILDEASLLACAAYVDLNPVRAAMAKTPEESDFTGAKDRMDDLSARESNSTETPAWERSRRREKSGWLSPLEINERTDPVGADASPVPRRASLKGFLSVSLADYLELLDWTGRQLQRGERGAIPTHLSPLLERIGLDPSCWCELVQKFGRLFKRAVGKATSLADEAARRGIGDMHAPGVSMMLAEDG